MESLARVTAQYIARKRTIGVDRASGDAGDRLYELVSVRLGPDPVFALMVQQAQAGGVTARTLRRLADSIAEAAESDVSFAGWLDRLVRELGLAGSATTASGERSVAIGGDNSGIVATGDGAINVQQRDDQIRPQ
jgi:hypothetical protein